MKAAFDKRNELLLEIEEMARAAKEKSSLANGKEKEEPEEKESEKRSDEAYNEETLAKVQNEVDEMQHKFDVTIEKKHDLEIELSSMKDRLKAATDLLESIKDIEKTWKQYVKEYSSNDVLICNCIVAAAFLVYCSPLNVDSRVRMGTFFLTICRHNDLPTSSKIILENFRLHDFLLEQHTDFKWKRSGLPYSPSALDASCLIIHDHLTNSWPMLCDVAVRSPSWLETYIKFTGQKLTSVRYCDIRSQLETSLTDGSALLVKDVDVNDIISDKRFSKLILARKRFTESTSPFKLQVGRHEVECRPSFRLFLHTTTKPSKLPPELSAYVTVINVCDTRSDIEEELLDRFTRLEKTRLWSERNQLLDERLEQLEKKKNVEEDIINQLASGTRLLSELNHIRKIAEFKKHLDETNETLSKVDQNDESVGKGREVYRVIAKRAAVCCDVGQHMAVIKPFYRISWNQFLELYDSSILHSDRSAVNFIVDRLMWSCYGYTGRMLLEKDRHIFSVVLALEVEESCGRLGLGEREFLISPHLGSITMAKIASQEDGREHTKVGQMKKPFDWMNDDAYNNLQILAVHFPWFREMFERMPRDGRETQWRSLCENEMAENVPLPDKMDEEFTPLQRMLIVRAVRPDRLLQLTTLYVNAVLGKRYTADPPSDIGTLLRTTKSSSPIAFIHIHEDAESAERLIRESALKRSVKLMTLTVCGLGRIQEKIIRKQIERAVNDQCWILLFSAQNGPKLLDNLTAFIQSKNPSENFRCFVIAKYTSALPTAFLHSSTRVTLDTPTNSRVTMQRALASIESSINRNQTRQELNIVLHNIVYLYAAVRLRAQFGIAGFVEPFAALSIDIGDLYEILLYAINEFNDGLQCPLPDGSVLNRSPSWSGIRFGLTDNLFGRVVGHSLDLAAISSMVDYWISPNATKKDFEPPRIKYRPPAAFFNPTAKLQQLIQSLDVINVQHLESPEASNIYSSSELVLANDQYVFTRINLIYDHMPSSRTLSHLAFPRPPTPLDGAPIAAISQNAAHAAIAIRTGVFASASAALVKMRKEIELWEICHTALVKLPKGYTRDYVIERAKKIGGFTPFNLFIINEVELMYKLLTEMKTSLTAIKSACELNSFGDKLTESQLQTAYDLYNQCIPIVWRKLAYETAPPPHHSLPSWINDLNNRCQHLDKLLVLGRDKMPAYWLGAFFQPSCLFAILKHDFYKKTTNERAGNIDKVVLQTEVTARDKEHIREPPVEGIFVYGIYMWGCHYDKTAAEMVDQPSRNLCSSLPVLHVTCWNKSDKPVLQDSNKANELYSCPVYSSRLARNNPILHVDVRKESIPSARWPLRGLHATIRPY